MMVINRLGTVHADRGGHTCNAAEYAAKRKAITPLQALVFQLPACDTCWPVAAEYKHIVSGARS